MIVYFLIFIIIILKIEDWINLDSENILMEKNHKINEIFLWPIVIKDMLKVDLN